MHIVIIASEGEWGSARSNGAGGCGKSGCGDGGGGRPGVGRGRVVGGLMAAGGGVECLCTVYFISVMDSFNLSDERSRNNETASALSAADTNPNAPSLC